MLLKIKLIFLLIFVSGLFGLFSTKTVFAANVNLTGKITDSSNNAIAGATVSVNDVNVKLKLF